MSEKELNARQRERAEELQRGLNSRITFRAANEDCAFYVVEGVTVIIGTEGGYGIPSVRTYEEGLESAVRARFLWEKQKRRDSLDLDKARSRITVT